MPLPKSLVDSLLGGQSGGIPTARLEIFTREQLANFGRVEFKAVPSSLSHDLEDRLQRRTSDLVTAVPEVDFRDSLLGFGDVQYPVGKRIQILLFWAEYSFVKHFAWVVKHATKVPTNESRGDAISEPTCWDFDTMMREVVDFFE